MLDLEREIEDLLKRHPDPRKPAGVSEYQRNQFIKSCPPVWGHSKRRKNVRQLYLHPIWQKWG